MPDVLYQLHPLLRLLLLCVLGPTIAGLSLLAACLLANVLLRFLECRWRKIWDASALPSGVQE